jgi:hypothetical protein
MLRLTGTSLLRRLLSMWTPAHLSEPMEKGSWVRRQQMEMVLELGQELEVQ